MPKKGIFPQQIVEAVQFRNDAIKLFRQLNEAYLAKDKQKVNELTIAIKKQVTKKTPNEVDLISQWAKEKVQPLSEAQDKKHKKSPDLYNQAYTYAKNQNLTILSVWDNKPPGSLLERKKT